MNRLLPASKIESPKRKTVETVAEESEQQKKKMEKEKGIVEREKLVIVAWTDEV